MTIRIGVIGILGCSFSLILSATAAVGQNRAGPGFVESIETEGDPATGIDMEEDAAAAQAEQIAHPCLEAQVIPRLCAKLGDVTTGPGSLSGS